MVSNDSYHVSFPELILLLTHYFCSSTADEACLVNSGSISSGGCNGLRACYVNEGDIGEAACSSLEKTIEEGIDLVGDLDDYRGACSFNWATIGSSSCSLFGACYGNSFESLDPLPIGSDSWYVVHSQLFYIVYTAHFLIASSSPVPVFSYKALEIMHAGSIWGALAMEAGK